MWRLGAVALILLGGISPVAAADRPDTHVTVYGGTAMDNALGDMGWPPAWEAYDNQKLAGVAVGREIARVYDDKVGIEIEGQVMRHWGKQDLWEGVGAGLVRWHPLPWDKWVESSVAAGAGVSHMSEISEIEQQRNRKQARTIGYLVFEVTAAPVREAPWDGVLRWHHRSGGYGTFNGVTGGSNYLVLGARRHF